MAAHVFNADLLEDQDNDLTYTSVAQVVELDGPEITVENVDVTHLKSADAFKEYLPGFADGDEISGSLRYTAAQFNTLMGYVRTAAIPWKIATAAGDELAFTGHITRLGLSIPEEGDITVPFAIKVTGKPTFTAA